MAKRNSKRSEENSAEDNQIEGDATNLSSADENKTDSAPVIFRLNSLRRVPKQTAPIEDLAAGKKWRLKMTEAEICGILQRATFESIQLVPLGSNYTFMGTMCDELTGKQYASIYKPMRGEAPLWDFPSGTLYKREYAAYRVARAWDWHFIPPVVIREGPHGVGTVQLFVDVDENVHYYQFRERYAHELKRIAIFDLITNNADRKAGHCLLGLDNHLWGIDHGLCFHTVPKMRTIIWDFTGEQIPEDIVTDLMEFATDSLRVRQLEDELTAVLDRREVDTFFKRLEQVLQQPYFPHMSSRRQVPWGFF